MSDLTTTHILSPKLDKNAGDKSSLTNRQIFFLVYLSLIGSMLFSGIPYAVKWFDLYFTLSYLIQGVVATIFCLFCGSRGYANTDDDNESTTFFDKINLSCGRGIAVAISFLILISVIVYVGYTINNTALLIKEAILPRTSIVYTVAIILLCSVFCADKGIRSVGRVCEVFGVITMLLLAVIILTSIFSIDIYNLLPMTPTGMVNTVMTKLFTKEMVSSIGFIFPIITIIVVQRTTKDHNTTPVSTTAIKSVWSVVLTMVLITFIVVGVMGLTQSKSYSDSLLIAIKQTSLPLITFMQRLDIVVITAMVFAFFCSVGALLCVCHELTTQIFKKKLNRRVKNVVTLIATAVAVGLFQLDLLTSSIGNIVIYFVTVISLLLIIVVSAIRVKR